MLLNLHVKNMMLIEHADINFTDNLNILTGETGAGKSILIGSIVLALGGRVSKELIRKGAEYGQVELLFSIENETTLDMLHRLEIEDENGELLISRKIYENRVVNKIGDQTVTAAKLKSVAEILLDLHAQHEQQSLTKKGYQMDLLDRYGADEISDLRKQVSSAYYAYKEAEHELLTQDFSDTKRERKMDLISYELEEIRAAMLVAGEDETLSKAYKKMQHMKELIQCVQRVHELTGYEQEESAGSLVGKAVSLMNQASAIDEELAALEGQMMDIEALVSDFNREISDYIDNMQFDEKTFSETEQRIDLINHLKVKYGNTIEEILDYEKMQQEAYDKLVNYAAYIDELKAKKTKLENVYLSLAQKLHEKRLMYAKKLGKEILSSLTDLNFQNAQFEIAVNLQETYSATGIDEVVFMICANVGEKKRPVSEVASGGELSRIMLAIKAVMADKDETDTLIFDEIDVGISGRTAQKVSEKLHQIACHHQVICITHLPQIAAMADSHYRIEKTATDKKTVTQIVRLSEEDTVGELARLLGGVEITDTVMDSAREMKKMAMQIKQHSP